jgi:hypothetical protein
MRFDRRPRLEGIEWTARKEAAFLSRHECVAKRLQRDIPLFADQHQPEPATQSDVEAERERRQRAAYASGKTMRDLDAKHWRQGRAAYFACAPEMRAAIREKWRAWRGPANAGCFIYVVEQINGDAERRWQQHLQRRRALIERIFRSEFAQSALPIE